MPILFLWVQSPGRLTMFRHLVGRVIVQLVRRGTRWYGFLGTGFEPGSSSMRYVAFLTFRNVPSHIRPNSDSIPTSFVIWSLKVGDTFTLSFQLMGSSSFFLIYPSRWLRKSRFSPTLTIIIGSLIAGVDRSPTCTTCSGMCVAMDIFILLCTSIFVFERLPINILKGFFGTISITPRTVIASLRCIVLVSHFTYPIPAALVVKCIGDSVHGCRRQCFAARTICQLLLCPSTACSTSSGISFCIFMVSSEGFPFRPYRSS